MNDLLLDLLGYMRRHNIIGAKHLPERLLFISRLKHVNRQSQKEFYDAYELLIHQKYFIRLKKRTGKGTEYHISLNPEMLEELERIMEGNDEIP